MSKIEEYKNIDMLFLKEKNLTELSAIYQGKNADLKDCLISEIKENFFMLYRSIKNCKLDEYIIKYEDAISCFLNFNHAFFIKYTHEIDKDEKVAAFSLIGSSQVHLTKLQSQYNQLIYRKQRKQYVYSMIIAGVALIFTVFFGFWQNKTPCSCCPAKTEQTQTIPETENSEVGNNALTLPDTIK